MTNLNCDVKTCYYNDNKCCCRQEIDVEGAGALNADMTCCGSFRENNEASKNSCGTKACKETNIKCEVTNCLYNESHKCTAGTVDVTGTGAVNCGQTECATFKHR